MNAQPKKTIVCLEKLNSFYTSHSVVWCRWEEVAAFSQVVVKSLRLVSELDLPDAHSEFIASWHIEGDGVDFPGLNFFLAYGEKVSDSHPSHILPLPLSLSSR